MGRKPIQINSGTDIPMGKSDISKPDTRRTVVSNEVVPNCRALKTYNKLVISPGFQVPTGCLLEPRV